MRSLIPGPRSELLCSQLGPIISERLGKGGDPALELPVPPALSFQILKSLPETGTPRAWILR
jgi:hypothetical protein